MQTTTAKKLPNWADKRKRHQLNITAKMTSLKGPGEAQQHDGSALRIGIVHARWNTCKLKFTHPTSPPASEKIY
jgi:hypothetical protein